MSYDLALLSPDLARGFFQLYVFLLIDPDQNEAAGHSPFQAAVHTLLWER